MANLIQNLLPLPGFRMISASHLNSWANLINGAFSGTTSITSLKMTGLLFESFTDGITAKAGGGQSGATQLTTEVNRVTTVATVGDSVALPAAVGGLTILVINGTSNPMGVFGSGTDTVDGNAAASGVTQMQNSNVIYTCPATGVWVTNGIGTGYSGSLPTVSSTDALTAHAGGGQASALQLTTVINRITTVGTAADSVKLPVSAPGLQITVINAAATNAMQVFGTSPDTINGIATGTGVSVAAGKTANFYCTVAGAWHMLLSA